MHSNTQTSTCRVNNIKTACVIQFLHLSIYLCLLKKRIFDILVKKSNQDSYVVQNVNMFFFCRKNLNTEQYEK